MNSVARGLAAMGWLSGWLVLAACGDLGPVGDAACQDRFPVSQAESEPCCAEWNVDACGAGLFCAAFDGREQTTCYREYSRRNLTSCTEDRQCASASCNTDQSKCRGMQYESCETAVGCAPANAYGTPLSCVSQECTT
ncbi:MAG: hypothetical protein ABIJ09_12460 [Pseudomonadota bacterium]